MRMVVFLYPDIFVCWYTREITSGFLRLQLLRAAAVRYSLILTAGKLALVEYVLHHESLGSAD